MLFHGHDGVALMLNEIYHLGTIRFYIIVLKAYAPFTGDCWFSHDVTKIQTKKLSILPRFYFHDELEQLKTNCQTNFCFKGVLGFVIEYA